MIDKLKLAACALLPLALLGTSAAAAQSFEDGRRAYDLGEYANAKTIWIALAQAGDAKSAVSLGYMYREGKGLPRDANAAARWYYKAALHDDPTAQAALCDIHLNGDGVRRDVGTALFWCELSIAGGETSAMELREHAMRRLTAEQRHLVWAKIAEWRTMPHDGRCCAAAAEARDHYAVGPRPEGRR
jgi:TPR repeat protein